MKRTRIALPSEMVNGVPFVAQAAFAPGQFGRHVWEWPRRWVGLAAMPRVPTRI